MRKREKEVKEEEGGKGRRKKMRGKEEEPLACNSSFSTDRNQR